MIGEFEYVPRREYQPVRIDVDNMLYQVQDELRPIGLTFQFHLIGSGHRGMVTRVKDGNRGFDLDYNLILQRCPEGSDAKFIHDSFLKAFRKVLRGSSYRDPEESTSVFTIKLVDSENSRISHSVDIAVIFYDEDGSQWYLRFDKSHRIYTFEPRGRRFDDRRYVQEIVDYYEDGWGCIRAEYLDLKNKNADPNKRSFDLYTEAVKNVHNWMVQEQDKDKSMDQVDVFTYIAGGGIDVIDSLSRNRIYRASFPAQVTEPFWSIF